MMNEFYFANFESKEILLNPDIKQRVLMMTGQSKDKNLELTKEQEKQIAHDFGVMFYSLATINWCNGLTLGMALQKALDQMSSFVKSKSNPEHPMNKYLHALDNQYRREISEHIMTSKYADKKIELNSELAKKWADESTKLFQKSHKSMNDLYKQYMPKESAKKKSSVSSFEKAKQKTHEKMMKILQIQYMNNERAA